MATPLDARIPATVLRLLKKYGQDATFVVPSVKTYNPTTGATTESGDVEHSEKITPPEGYAAHMTDGDVIRRGDRRTFIAASGLAFTPETDTRVLMVSGTEAWEIVAVDEIFSGESVAAYELQLRR